MTFALLALLVTQGSSFAYLRKATLTASVDTFDTFTSEPGGRPQDGSGRYVVRTVRAGSRGRWELVDSWYDSTGHETARQATRTAPRALFTELAAVRADVDSAAMLVSSDHVTAWVVPAGQSPRFYDGDASGERYDLSLVAAAIARARAAIGTTFRYSAYSLYGASPLETRIDSVRIARRDTLSRGPTRLPVIMLERSNGGRIWVDERTGTEVASRGNAGPGRWWWHIRRGFTPPKSQSHSVAP